MTYVFDASAIIALLKNEEGADVIDSLLVQAADGVCSVIMNNFNLLEVFYGFYREDGESFAKEQINAIKESHIKINGEISDDMFYQAGRIKASYSLSLADSILLGQAISEKATVVSSDHHEFEAVEKIENIEFLWFR